jgi:NAD(P)-dependent dehydrogenase (short-subunit alcohol dehydrogenase family)
MPMIDLSGRVAIVTGAGGGLGREHALLLARHGAKVLVNDLGGSVKGEGHSTTCAEQVVAEIVKNGGEGIANGASVTDAVAVGQMVDTVLARWGRVDILVNNAGILRDKTFSKMSWEEFRHIIDVHLMGAFHCTKAVWEHMKQQSYGRIVMTTSSSGLYGNFGQSNYSAAKLGLVGLMQTLGLEGVKYNIHVNCLAPSAGTRMLHGLMTQSMLEALQPASVSPGLVALVSESAPNRAILCAGAGSFERAYITLTHGVHVGLHDRAADEILSRWAGISDRTQEVVPEAGSAQSQMELQKAGFGSVAGEGS